MKNPFLNIRIASISLIACAVLLIPIGLAVVGAQRSVTGIDSIGETWHEFERGAATKGALLTDLHAAIGYGGVVHEFNTYMVRQDQLRVIRIQSSIRRATVALIAYESIGINEREALALAAIRQVVTQYAEAVAKAEQMVIGGAKALEIDQTLQINDGPALKAIKVLERELLTLRRDNTQKINLTVEFASNDVRTNAWVISLLLLSFLVLFFVLTRAGVVAPIARMTQALNRLARGDRDVIIVGQNLRNEIGEMAQAALVFRNTLKTSEDQNWVKSSVSEISKAVYRATTPQDAAHEILTQLVPLLEGGHGAFYFYEEKDNRLNLLGSYAHTQRKHVANSFALGESLVGQCALERQPIVLTNVPDDYVQINSGLGSSAPLTIAAYPIALKDELQGVIEIASFNHFSPIQLDLLTDLLPSIALYIDNLRRSSRTEDLLAQTQSQAQALMVSESELKVREEELQANNEELRQQTEALEQRTSELQASEEELRAQEEELRATNEELTEKTQTLEEQQVRLEAAKLEAEQNAQELERSSHYKSQFLANMSHELRTPLNSLLILAKGLADNESGNLNEDDVDSARIIHESGSLLLRLINDILDLSKVEAGEMVLHCATVELADIAQNIQRHFSHIAKEKGSELLVSIEDGLTESLYTDIGILDQILSNLLSNAFKFTDQGRVEVHFHQPSEAIELPLKGKGHDLLAISVTDDGIGIPQEKLRQIFEAFKQVDGSVSRKYGGTGLGLSISQKLATLLDGVVTVESVAGEGSTFTLYLPLTTAPREEMKGDPPLATAQPTAKIQVQKPTEVYIPDDRDAVEPGDKTILIIEDDPNFAKILRDRARRKGFKCLVVPDGETGLAFVTQYVPFGILLDISLPEMDGWSVMSRLKENPDTRHIPVHVISALDERGAGLEKGAVGYLTKPVSKDQLESVFEKIEHFTAGEVRNLLVVEDDPGSRKAIASIVASDGVVIHSASSGEMALEMLHEESMDCIILDLGLPEMSGFEFVETASRDDDVMLPPVVVYSGRELSAEEDMKLREYTDSVVIKGARSPERLLDEVTLFLHSVHQTLPTKQRKLLQKALDTEHVFAGKKVLVVDDDMRNAFALSKTLRAKGLEVVMAKDGEGALEKLDQESNINLVLMDVMMPGMDGYQTMHNIKQQTRFRHLPILAVTAKAMRGDREKCLEAGANDYLPKPIDMERLLSMMRAWL